MSRAIVTADEVSPLSPRARSLTLLALHAAFAVLVGVAAGMVIAGAVDGSRLVLAVVLMAWVAAYLLLRPVAMADLPAVRTTGYLLVLVAVVGVIAWVEPALLFLMFLAYPQVWFVVQSVRAGVAWTVVAAFAAVFGPLVAWTRGGEPLWGPGQTLVGMVFSLAMGLWVFSVIQQSDQRARLIRELEATRAELAEAQHARGVLAERERLAREVHDTLAQGYTSIVVLAQTAAAQLAVPAAAGERIALIEEVARENLAEARAMVGALAPVGLDDGTLVQALQRLAERFGRETGVASRVEVNGEADGLRRAEEVVLLRGAQEALTNVRRHAAASSVVLRVVRVGAVVSVQVEDDGVGFEPQTADGIGLAGLRDRAEEAGGAVEVVSVPGAGTRVTVRVPGS